MTHSNKPNQKHGLKGFKSYQIAVELFHFCQKHQVPGFLKNQLDRASSSVVLNLAEGFGKRSLKDQKRFYSISLGSLREVQSILEISHADSKLINKADLCGACLWRLIYPKN